MPSPFLPPSLSEECRSVPRLDPALHEQAQAHVDSLTKPRGSLGRLEELAVRLFTIQGNAPLAARPARMYTIAADHGVVCEGVAATPQVVTRLMVQNFLNGGGAINSLCAAAGADLRIVDAGVDAAPFPEHPMLLNAKIARGTANIAEGPAMTHEQCAKALQLGVDLAKQAHADGVRLLGTGEMGIGNTTVSSALLCAYLGFSTKEATGMGAGLPEGGLAHKRRVITRALHSNGEVVADQDPFAVLAALGGLEIAALAGLIIGGAARRMAIMIDGFIATAAFTAAWKLAPRTRGYCFFSHASTETGHGKALKMFGEKALLDLDMRLGEGTGAALGFFLLDAAARMFNTMATFTSAGIELSPDPPKA